jgi:hypothetical protein
VVAATDLGRAGRLIVARELRADGRTLEEVFDELVAGFTGLVCRDPGVVPDRMPIRLCDTEPERLPGRFVAELLDLVRTDRFVAGRLERFALEDGELRAAVSGWSGTMHPLVARVVRSDLRYDVELTRWRAAVLLG